MGGEDSGHVDMSFPAQGDSETGLPLVEVGDNRLCEIVHNVLR